MALDAAVPARRSGLAGKCRCVRPPLPGLKRRNRRIRCAVGFLRATANHHALEHADGTPFFVIGDTWYPQGGEPVSNGTTTTRSARSGPSAGFKDYVRYRKAQGYNWVNIIAAFPNWMNDGQPWHVRVTTRNGPPFAPPGWNSAGRSAKNMDNEGGRPFMFPGKVPGYESCSPT